MLDLPCGLRGLESAPAAHGHIELATPVVHTWYARGVPNRIALLLNIQVKELQAIIDYASYLVLHKEEALLARYKEVDQQMDSTEAKLRVKMYESIEAGTIGILEGDALLEYMSGALGDTESLVLDTGADAIRQALSGLDLYEMSLGIRDSLEELNPEDGDRNKLITRLKVVDSFIAGGSRPEWMVMDVLPVLPPDLRPILEMDSGRVASSDINDLYLRVIHRNKRLQRLTESRFNYLN